jgi:hypothetical protein
VNRLIIAALLALLVTGCGYRPTAHLARDVLGDNVYIYVAMSRVDPQNTVLIKDAIASALVDRFGSEIVPENLAHTKLYIQLQSVEFNPLVYDANGYVISYRTVARLKIDYHLKGGNNGTITTSGDYDFPIAADSIISDTKRFEAIQYASVDAIDEFTALVAVQGMKQERAAKAK